MVVPQTVITSKEAVIYNWSQRRVRAPCCCHQSAERSLGKRQGSQNRLASCSCRAQCLCACHFGRGRVCQRRAVPADSGCSPHSVSCRFPSVPTERLKLLIRAIYTRTADKSCSRTFTPRARHAQVMGVPNTWSGSV
ncbi:hypothetical protein AAFF_G00198700 [Aldrovandia affinis]|uniref:Uncharacterized protein n=1 Tax=Aldrovandia affinis TaxID=143900 RepID=A0AAD7RIC6_9TELE|nr:hypothetical protein AAFF_G00198700 [Aldrovandia affinis]